MKRKVLFGLVLCNFVWSANPAMAKIVLRDFPAPHTAVLRYSSALIALIVMSLFMRQPAFVVPKKRKDLLWLLALGFFSFCYSPFLHIIGLASTRATDGALITAMEPLVTVLLACVLLGERISAVSLFSFAIALFGFGLLADFSPSRLSQALTQHFIGNVIILLSLAGEAFYSTAGRHLVQRFRPVPIFGSGLLIGVIGLFIASVFHSGVISLTNFSWSSFLGILWLGPIGTTLTYVFWMNALRNASVASVALTLFVQPIMGSVWGYIFLDERLNLLQSLGGGLILIALLGHQLIAGSQNVILQKKVNI